MTENAVRSVGRTFDLVSFLHHFVRRWYITVALALLFTVFGFFYTKLFCKPVYNSTAKLYIFNASASQTSSSELTISTYLTKDYSELIVDRTVLNQVIQNLGLNMSYGSIRGAITVENPENTRILAVTVCTGDPDLSRRIADEICKVAQEKIVELMKVERVNIISPAYLPTSSSGQSTKTNMSYGFLSGILVSAMLIGFLSFLDDKIKSSEDIEQYLGVSVLGTIPFARGRIRSTSIRSATTRT